MRILKSVTYYFGLKIITIEKCLLNGGLYAWLPMSTVILYLGIVTVDTQVCKKKN